VICYYGLGYFPTLCVVFMFGDSSLMWMVFLYLLYSSFRNRMECCLCSPFAPGCLLRSQALYSMEFVRMLCSDLLFMSILQCIIPDLNAVSTTTVFLHILGWMIGCSSSVRSSEFFSSPPHAHRLLGPSSLLSNGYQGLFPWG
jgi:hypothetical protein